MFKHEKKIQNLFIYWLTISLFLIFSIIIVGGLTRLTNSGLSITEWELFKGILPPITEKSWNEYFDLYKNIPQYQLINFDMSLSEFKVIFYWEYFHRVLGRVIGLFFLIPLIFFFITNKINRNYLNLCFLILFLIVIQGFVGWYMVKSGLVNDVTVSHYRLSLHLIIALIIISMNFWLILNFKDRNLKKFFNLSSSSVPFLFLFFLIFLQIIFGAFVSGLDAGKLYQTWPLMGYTYFPNDLDYEKLVDLFNFNNHSLVQFYHRNLAYVITLYIFFLSLFIFRKKIKRLFKPTLIMLFFLFTQVFLGIYTLISGLNIYLASAHQITSVLLVFSSINLYYLFIK